MNRWIAPHPVPACAMLRTIAVMTGEGSAMVAARPEERTQ
jgi:hypothetical protein